MIKYGFLIEDGKIYDTKIPTYKIKREYSGENILCSMVSDGYKRLHLYEPLLWKYNIDKVFEILNFNTHLKKQRQSAILTKVNKLHFMSNMSMVYNYPPTFLTQRKFSLYKICQNLKKRLS